MRLTKQEEDALELEIVPHEARLELTRLVREACRVENVQNEEELAIMLLRENNFVNIANQVLGRRIYVLDGGDLGEYHPAEYAWHHGQRELVMRLPTTAQLAQILADYLQESMLEVQSVNQILSTYGCGFSYRRFGSGADDRTNISLKVIPVDSIPNVDLKNDHPNIRKLVSRMEKALEDKDFAAVLHAAASVFETLAKDVIENPAVENRTLKAFFDGYRKKSALPDPILDYMLQVYGARNTEPLAGHGHLKGPSITSKEAVAVCELTKAIVRMERTLAEQTVAQQSLRPSKNPIWPRNDKP